MRAMLSLIDPTLPPELPQLPDLIASVCAWGAAELLKRIARGRTWERGIRRALPVIVAAVGAGVRMLVAALADGTPWQTALVRGLVAGGAAVYVHTIRSSTVGGQVGGQVPPSDVGRAGAGS